MSEEDLPSDPFPAPPISFAPCPCGKTHEEHGDADTMTTLASLINTLLPGKRVALAFTDDSGGVGVIANVGTDAQTINLFGLAIAKVYSSSADKASLPMSILPLRPEDN